MAFYRDVHGPARAHDYLPPQTRSTRYARFASKKQAPSQEPIFFN